MFQELLKIAKIPFRFLEILIFPKSCLICNQIITDGYFCTSDFNKLQFLSKPACKICYHPFEFKIDDDMLCPNCLAKTPSYFQSLSIFKYNQASKNLITKLKYSDKTYMAEHFAKLMHNNSQEILKNDIDLIVPVPLHKKRLRKRKYNQSALIVNHLSKLTNITAIYDLLIRVKNTIPQSNLSQKLRRKNIVKAFTINQKYKESVKGDCPKSISNDPINS